MLHPNKDHAEIRGIAAVNWFERSAAGGRRSDARTGRNRESQKGAEHPAETTYVSTGAGRPFE